MNETTPGIGIEETCVPLLLCVGPATVVAPQNISTPLVEEQEVAQTPGTEDEEMPVPLLLDETTPNAGVRIDMAPIESEIDPLGQPGVVGPVNITVPNPFGDDIPLSLCPEGCPVPATVGEASLETQVMVTIWVVDEEHSETVPVVL